MANTGNHTRPTPSRWRRGMSATRRAARYAEGMVERHWPFAAYSLATLATAGYVVGQLAKIVT